MDSVFSGPPENVPLVTGWSSSTAAEGVGPGEELLKEPMDPSGRTGL